MACHSGIRREWSIDAAVQQSTRLAGHQPCPCIDSRWAICYVFSPGWCVSSPNNWSKYRHSNDVFSDSELRGPLGGADLRSAALSQTPVYSARLQRGASASRGVSVQSPSITPVPDYTAWWQKHMGVNNLPKFTKQRYPAKSRTRDLLVIDPMIYQVSHHAKGD